ncbi:MAG TPA: hypothetical protein G4O11_11575 [Anaerolineae bacterium]|nr:hypothetical protein [Anaerolineae bacterium]
MKVPKRTLDENIIALTGTLLAISGMVTAIANLCKSFVSEPNQILYAVSVVLLIAGVWALWHGLARRSRLLRPDALLLRAEKTEHLAGRSEDIERLSKLCTDYTQVHLVGESGAGKSALVRAGLCLGLRVQARLIPIYLDVWGQDWETGPRAALASALWEALSEKDRDSIGLTEPPEPEDLLEIIRRSKVKLGREPLLIFDQFDDYQTRHQSRFLPSRRRTWLPADKLIKVNSFWRDIKNLVSDEGVHCLFVTRTDTADGLESIHFVSPQVYRLDRLNVDSIQPFLTHLTSDTEGSDPVVFAPDHGWDRLKDRLARDLSKDGAVLPVQMKIALQNLAGLGALTVRDYERKGGLRGLEAAHVQQHVSGAARNFNLTRSQVRTLLLAMVDPEALKTIPKSTDDLQKAVIRGDKRDSGRLQQTVQVVLNYLEQREIIRKRLDPDTHQHVWILDHDYLCRGVLETEHRASRWFITAQESHRAFREAGRGIWRKWKSLLNPWHQVVLASLRLAGRFRYGDMRPFAALSLLRFLPFLILGGAAFFFFVDKGIKNAQEAYQIIANAQGKSGDLGRKDALHYLHKNGANLKGIDISRANLSGLSLPGADLTDANFAAVVLEDANLAGAHLIRVNLTDADLSKANLSQAKLDDANLSGKANFYMADLTDANLPRADLSGADFRMAQLAGADLCDATFHGVDLSDANLTGAKLTNAKLTESANLTDANFPGAILHHADLSGAKLISANLTGADLSWAVLTGADLFEAQLNEAKIIDANLTEAKLAGADLTGADLTRAQLFQADLTGADLSNANLLNIRQYDFTKSVKDAKIYNVKNPPGGFLEWAQKHGAETTVSH